MPEPKTPKRRYTALASGIMPIPDGTYTPPRELTEEERFIEGMKQKAKVIDEMRAWYDEIERRTGKKVITSWDPRMGPIPDYYIWMPGIW